MEETRMKNSTKLASAALIAAIGFGALAPQAVKAADDTSSLTGKGKVQFTAGTQTTDTTPITNPSGGSASSGATDQPITSGGTTQPVGAFGINYVSDLDFAKHDIVSSNANTETYWATKWSGNSGAVTNANFIKFKDIRNTVQTHGYTISAAITKQFTSENSSVLNGATITYTNPSLVADSGYSAVPTGLQAAPVVSADASTNVLVNPSNGTTGYGAFSLLWGQGGNEDKSVQLSIPRGTTNAVITQGTYNAEVTWTMTAAPQA